MRTVADNAGQAQQTPSSLPRFSWLFRALALTLTMAMLHAARFLAAVTIVVVMVVDFFSVAVVATLHLGAMVAFAMHSAIASGTMFHTRIRAVLTAPFAVRFAHIVHRIEFSL